MNNKVRSLLLSFVALAAAGPALAQAPAPAQVTAIRAGRLIDGTGKAAVENAVIIVRGERIENVGPAASVAIPAGAKVIDLSRQTVLPGLIDGHTHPYENLDWTVPDTVRMTYIAQGLRVALLSGTTTAFVQGEIHGMDVVARDAVREGRLTGPRVYPSGHWIATTSSWGGVLDETYDGPDEIRKAVRQQYQLGAHHIKLLMEPKDWRSQRPYPKGTSNFTKEELDAAVSEAHRLGVKVFAHSYGDAIKLAVDAGADVIIHGEDLNPETISLLREKNVGVIANLANKFGRYYPERWTGAAKLNGPVEWVDAWRQAGMRGRQTDADFGRAVQKRLGELRALKQAGVVVVAGTDNVPGMAQMETELLVEAGWTPLEAISAATGASAKLLGIDGDVGAIVKGRFADIIAVPGRPDQNIKDLNDVRFIMWNGKDYSNLSWR